MKKLLILVLTISLILFSGCGSKKDSDSTKFKSDYEQMNGKVNSSNKEYRTVKIDSENKFVEITEEELIKKFENKESFYIYFGSTLCPWCRSVIEMADKVSRENNIDVIYYFDIWDSEGKEIFRDTYRLDENNNPELVSNGSENYKKIIEILSSVLSDYTLKDSQGNTINVGEKRIYAPNFIYILNGKPIRLVTGISQKQGNDSRAELTKEILEDEETAFSKFFTNTCSSDSVC